MPFVEPCSPDYPTKIYFPKEPTFASAGSAVAAAGCWPPPCADRTPSGATRPPSPDFVAADVAQLWPSASPETVGLGPLAVVLVVPSSAELLLRLGLAASRSGLRRFG